jgi:hypothetical protein
MPTPLDAEAAAWRDLPPEEYDLAVCAVLDGLPTTDPTILPLASATLRRDAPTVTTSVARCAEHLIAFAAKATEPERARSRWLFMLAWLRLAAVAARGPEKIASTPPLPEGVILPTGADPFTIDDAGLRDQARAAAEEHGAEVARWNAKQQALRHLESLGDRLHGSAPGFTDDPEIEAELVAAIALASGRQTPG